MVKFVAVLVALVVGAVGGFVVAAIGGAIYVEMFAAEAATAEGMSDAFFTYGPKGAIAGAVVAIVTMWRQLRKSPDKYATAPNQAPRPESREPVTPPRM